MKLRSLLYVPADNDAFIAKAHQRRADAIILDLELIPLQNPPLDIDGKIQYNDWCAILLDNGTIEVFDPFVTGGELVEVISMAGVLGDVMHMDVADNTADIFVSQDDIMLPKVSVFTIQ